VDFLPGLNVVLGPNEAGKSTLFHAVRHVLFVPAKLRKPEFDSKIVPCCPRRAATLSGWTWRSAAAQNGGC